MLVGAVSFAAIAVLIIRIAFWDSFAGKVIRYLVNNLWSDYFLIFASAFIIGRFRIYEKIACKVIFPTTVYLIALFAVILIRWICVTGPAQSNYDPLLTPVLVLSLVGLIHKMKSENPIVRCLRYFGKYSTFIWLTHTFWIYYYFQPIVLAAKYSALIFIWALVISLVNAILLNKLYELITKFMQLRLHRRKII